MSSEKELEPKTKDQKKKRLLIVWGVVVVVLGVAIAVIIILAGNHNPPACTNPSIKGNISQTGEKIYHKPGDRYYTATQIDTSKGEKYFCTDKEAQDAGWRHSKV